MSIKTRNNLPSQVQVQMKMSSGPIPDPATLQAYNDLLPGAADRIITMAEKQQAHRHSMEKKDRDAVLMSEYIQPFLAFLLAVIMVGVVAVLCYYDKNMQAFVIGLSAITTMLGARYFMKNKE